MLENVVGKMTKVMKMNMDTAPDVTAEVAEGADDFSNAMLQQYLKPATQQRRASSITFTGRKATQMGNIVEEAVKKFSQSSKKPEDDAADGDAHEGEATAKKEGSMSKSSLPTASESQQTSTSKSEGAASPADSLKVLGDVVVTSDSDPSEILPYFLSSSGANAEAELESWGYDSSLFNQSELCNQFGCARIRKLVSCFCTCWRAPTTRRLRHSPFAFACCSSGGCSPNVGTSPPSTSPPQLCFVLHTKSQRATTERCRA